MKEENKDKALNIIMSLSEILVDKSNKQEVEIKKLKAENDCLKATISELRLK